MKTYNRESNGIKVSVWNDSGADWMVQDSERTVPYPINKFTMKGAVKLHGEIFGGKA